MTIFELNWVRRLLIKDLILWLKAKNRSFQGLSGSASARRKIMIINKLGGSKISKPIILAFVRNFTGGSKVLFINYFLSAGLLTWVRFTKRFLFYLPKV